jgi:type IV pilus assembly protein PilE
MQNQGFSLFEMLVVLLILGILLSFTYPSYQMYWTRAHRLEGQIAVLDLANKMEQYFTKYGTYAQASIGSHSEHDVLSTALTTQGWYALSIQTASETHYSLQAIPQNSQAQQDMRCQTLQINDQGIQSIASGPGGNPTGDWEYCWR